MADKILQFLTEHQRPFSANDIVQGLNQELGKSKLQSILNDLVRQQKVVEKCYGKQKIYCISQESDIPASKISETILEIDRKSNALSLKLKEVEDNVQKNSNQLKDLEGKLTVEEALQMKQKLEEDIAELELKLENSASKTYDKDEKDKIMKDYNLVLKEYNKRKRICLDMVEAIFENYPKSKKHLIQELGIETDEDVDFKLKVQ